MNDLALNKKTGHGDAHGKTIAPNNKIIMHIMIMI